MSGLSQETPVVMSVSQFVASLNQTLDYAYNQILVIGEVANLRTSKGRWLYFDIVDEGSSVRCFGSLISTLGVIENGMTVQLTAAPRLHNRYGLSLNIYAAQPIGEGSIKRAADLVRQKLEKEGLFDSSRKRQLPSFPRLVALVTSSEAAAYSDFIKVLNKRWQGVEVVLYDSLVQGDQAAESLVRSIAEANQNAADLLVVTRGGGSTSDLAAFDDERVVRAIASSRLPTLVAIGHERDLSLSEMAADMRAATPSNAAEIAFPDRQQALLLLERQVKNLSQYLTAQITSKQQYLALQTARLKELIDGQVESARRRLELKSQVLEAFHPLAPLDRGFALVRDKLSNKVMRSVQDFRLGQELAIESSWGNLEVQVNKIKPKEK